MAKFGTETQVRPGVESDLEALTDIYDHDVRETALTFDTVPFTLDRRLPWLRAPTPKTARTGSWLLRMSVMSTDRIPGSWAVPRAAPPATVFLGPQLLHP